MERFIVVVIHWLGAHWTSIVASLSFGVALWALVESKRVTRQQQIADLRSQATQIIVSPLDVQELTDQPAKIRVIAKVHNYSFYPIQEVWLKAHSRMIHTDQHVLTFTLELIPSGELVLDQIIEAEPNPYPLAYDDRLLVDASFTDRNGYRWQRWATGEIKPPIDLRRQWEFYGIIRKMVPNKLRLRWARRRNRPPVRASLPDTR